MKKGNTVSKQLKTKKYNLVHILIAMVVAGVVGGVIVNAYAAPGGKGKGNSTTPNTSLVLTVPNGTFGSSTTATLTTSSGAAVYSPTGTQDWQAYWAHIQCYKSGDRVANGYQQFVNGKATLQLGPTASWTSGGASCDVDAGQFIVNSKGLAELRVDVSKTITVAP